MRGLSYLLAALVAGAPEAQRSQAVYPEQRLPLHFDHAQHLAGGATCGACHSAARKSAQVGDRNLPQHPECEDCHDIQAAAKGEATDPPAACQVCHPGYDGRLPQNPPQLVLPTAHLKFDHQRHLALGAKCEVCHQGLPQASLGTRQHLPKMATCLECHDGRQASGDCSTCHLTTASGRLKLDFTPYLRPMRGNPLGLDHGARFDLTHATRAKAHPASCAACHAEAECQACHDGIGKPLRIHANDFVLAHSAQARTQMVRCESCHRMQSFCVPCHERAGVSRESAVALRAGSLSIHPPPEVWVENPGPQHHGLQATRDLPQCISCHREETCMSCHSQRGLRGTDRAINPHPAGFAARCRMLAAKNDRPCVKCHGEQALADLGCR